MTEKDNLSKDIVKKVPEFRNFHWSIEPIPVTRISDTKFSYTSKFSPMLDDIHQGSEAVVAGVICKAVKRIPTGGKMDIWKLEFNMSGFNKDEFLDIVEAGMGPNVGPLSYHIYEELELLMDDEQKKKFQDASYQNLENCLDM